MAGLLVSLQVAAAEKLEQSSWQAFTSSLWQIFIFLCIFGLVIFLAIIVTRFWVRQGAGISAAGSRHHLRLLEHQPLGTGKGLCLVKVVDTVLLLSVTDKEITVLKELPWTTELDVATPAAKGILPRWLANLLPNANPEVTSNDDQVPEPESGFAKELRQRLERLKGSGR